MLASMKYCTVWSSVCTNQSISHEAAAILHSNPPIRIGWYSAHTEMLFASSYMMYEVEPAASNAAMYGWLASACRFGIIDTTIHSDVNHRKHFWIRDNVPPAGGVWEHGVPPQLRRAHVVPDSGRAHEPTKGTSHKLGRGGGFEPTLL